MTDEGGTGGTGLFRPAADYFANVRGFSRNARLFLSYALLSGLGTGIWVVMFNLYLLRLDYETTFIGLFWLVDMLFHGLFAFPAGLIGDKIGRRKTFILATVFALSARGLLLFTRDQNELLLLAALAGMGEGFHAVAGAPFMMENSEEKERPHLFSLNASLMMISLFVGSLSGGWMPRGWAAILNVGHLEPSAARWALVTSLPLTFVALVPLAVIREKPVELVESFRDLFSLRNVVHYDIIFKLTLVSTLTGIVFGMTTRFFNIFFKEDFDASDETIGLFLAIGSLASAAVVLFSPYVTRRLGMARGTMLAQLGSVPFLLMMAVVGDLSVVVFFFAMRAAVYSVSMPLSTQLSMMFVIPRERATTAGLTHMAFDLGGAVGAGAGGVLIHGGDFLGAFSIAAALLVVPAVLYYVFFARLEDARREPAPA